MMRTQAQRIGAFLDEHAVRGSGAVDLPALGDGDAVAQAFSHLVTMRRAILADQPWQVAYMVLIMEVFALGYKFRENEYQRAVETEALT